MIEAIDVIQKLTGKELKYTLSDDARSGDHIWWVSDVSKFQKHYPKWAYKYDINTIIKEIVDATAEREGIKV